MMLISFFQMLLLTCNCLNVKIYVKLTKAEFDRLKEESK